MLALWLGSWADKGALALQLPPRVSAGWFLAKLTESCKTAILVANWTFIIRGLEVMLQFHNIVYALINVRKHYYS